MPPRPPARAGARPCDSGARRDDDESAWRATPGTGPLSNAPVPAPAAIEAQLTALIGKPGGLTADQAATRARQTSYDVRARKAEAVAAQSTVDQAKAAYVPRIKGTAGYQRTSPLIVFPLLSVPERRSRVSGIGPFPRSPYPQDNWNLQVDADVPLSDYVLKIAKQHSAAEHSARAAQLTERAAELTASSNARIQYYSWARARLQEVVAEDATSRRELTSGTRRRSSPPERRRRRTLSVSRRRSPRTSSSSCAPKTRWRSRRIASDRAADDSARAYEIGEPLLADLPAIPGEENFNALFTEALNRRPELRSIIESARGLRMQAGNKMDILPKLDAHRYRPVREPEPALLPADERVERHLGRRRRDHLERHRRPPRHHQRAARTKPRAQSTEAQALSMRDGIRDEVMQAFQAVHEAETAIDSTSRASPRPRSRTASAAPSSAPTAPRAPSSPTRRTPSPRARFDVVNARIDLRVSRVFASSTRLAGTTLRRRPPGDQRLKSEPHFYVGRKGGYAI